MTFVGHGVGRQGKVLGPDPGLTSSETVTKSLGPSLRFSHLWKCIGLGSSEGPFMLWKKKKNLNDNFILMMEMILTSLAAFK